MTQTEEEQELWDHEAKSCGEKCPTAKEAVAKVSSNDNVVGGGQKGYGTSPSAEVPHLNLY